MKISLKSEFLIGQELRMLASHWSRGQSENFQRGKPYVYSEVLRDSGVGILFQWHYTQETDNYAHLDSGVSILFQWHYTRETDTILNQKSLGTLAWAFYNNGTTRQRPTIRTLAWAFYST